MARFGFRKSFYPVKKRKKISLALLSPARQNKAGTKSKTVFLGEVEKLQNEKWKRKKMETEMDRTMTGHIEHWATKENTATTGTNNIAIHS